MFFKICLHDSAYKLNGVVIIQQGPGGRTYPQLCLHLFFFYAYIVKWINILKI